MSAETEIVGNNGNPGPLYLPRVGAVGDAEGMGSVAYRIVGLDVPRATQEVLTVLGAPFVASAVVERVSRVAEREIVAVMNGVLLRPWFSAYLLEGERPYFHNQVRDAPEPPFARPADVGRANTGRGLDLFLTHLAVDDRLPDADTTRVRNALVDYFVQTFAGNRLQSLMVETVGWENTAVALGAGFETVSTHPRWRAANRVLEREGPHLLRIDLERAMQVQNFHTVRMLQYRSPAIRFPAGAQELLRLAVLGLPDAEIAARYGFTARSVASSWTRILAKAKRALPELFAVAPEIGKSRDRLALLAYLHQYPEELWPYG